MCFGKSWILQTSAKFGLKGFSVKKGIKLGIFRRNKSGVALIGMLLSLCILALLYYLLIEGYLGSSDSNKKEMDATDKAAAKYGVDTSSTLSTYQSMRTEIDKIDKRNREYDALDIVDQVQR